MWFSFMLRSLRPHTEKGSRNDTAREALGPFEGILDWDLLGLPRNTGLVIRAVYRLKRPYIMWPLCRKALKCECSEP